MRTGRPPEYDLDEVLDAAMQVFWRQGYDATSLQDLLDEMNLSKSSVYQTFESKHELFVRCVSRYRHQTATSLLEYLESAANGIEFIADTLRTVTSEAYRTDAPKGCLIVNTAIEFGQSDQEIAQSVADGLDGYRDVFLKAVIRGQTDRSVRNDMPPDTLASYLLSNASGLRIMVKAGTDDDRLDGMVDMVLNSISPQSSTSNN